MNSEELELSLRTEFEIYLKGVFDGMRQDVADFQKNFEAEFDKHRSQMDESIRKLSTRFESDIKFDKAFTESVLEHLRLARDDGAQVSARAFNEAQKLDQNTPSARYDQLRDAIRSISSQTTQSEILRSLVDHVSSFTARGAFFIVKHDSFVCWRRFDGQRSSGEDSLRDIHFPLAADTLLVDAVRSRETRESSAGARPSDVVYLDALALGRPDRMHAVPLLARGRGVAVLYVDSGHADEPVNLEAIESLVRVAGLTVELRAASTATPQPSAAEAPSYVAMPPAEVQTPTASGSEISVSSETVTQPDDAPQFEEYIGEVVEETEVAAAGDRGVAEEAPASNMDMYTPVVMAEETIEAPANYEAEEVMETQPAEQVNDFAFAPNDSYEMPVPAEHEPVEDYSFTPGSNGVGNGHAYEPAPEPDVEVATSQPVKSRLSERHVDLPIEVPESERRVHNDARRFARLLVSEIKLYNEQQVNDGRKGSDLYDRLREAIDRSREMYDKRVQPQVAAKFDYFHYELVSNLAEGNASKLGASYPGAHV